VLHFNVLHFNCGRNGKHGKAENTQTTYCGPRSCLSHALDYHLHYTTLQLIPLP
jgi:hypothetical protein